MHAERSDTIDFWPGYVDALINVVLNLLFVVSIFCGGLLATGLQIASPSRVREPPPVAVTPALVEPGLVESSAVEAALVAPAPQVPQTSATPVRPATREIDLSEAPIREDESPAPRGTTAPALENGPPGLPTLTLHVRSSSASPVEATPVRIEQVALPAGGWRLQVSFAIGALGLDEAASATLARWMTSERRDRTIQIAASTDLEQTTARQATYRRLIAVRDALVALGHAPARIEIRLLPGGAWPERRGGTVWIREMSEASPAAPAETSSATASATP
ncbi:hypothetical protein ACFJIX_15215 [Roseateles sp. UC29_93]|uniref:hypothetical protein n=1 Tax=Roseateles sp. UC29_93 TaxID=3350177 RepID=UPI0036708F88